jgi:large subunit ribosomal protein L15
MRLNTLKPAVKSKPSAKRVGRGVGSGLGKTCGRGHKGQRARAGGFHKVGFEGGQMPLQRRLPKRGFRSPLSGATSQIRLSELNRVKDEIIDLAALKKAGLASAQAQRAKVFVSGKLDKAVSLRGISVSKGAREAILSAGGKIEDQ